MEGLNLVEFQNHQRVYGYPITDYVLGDFEGEMLLYHKKHHADTISTLRKHCNVQELFDKDASYEDVPYDDVVELAVTYAEDGAYSTASNLLAGLADRKQKALIMLEAEQYD